MLNKHLFGFCVVDLLEVSFSMGFHFNDWSGSIVVPGLNSWYTDSEIRNKFDTDLRKFRNSIADKDRLCFCLASPEGGCGQESQTAEGVCSFPGIIWLPIQ